MLEDQTPRSHRGAHLLQSLRAFPLWRQRLQLLSRPEGLSSFLAHVVATSPRYRSLAATWPGAPLLADFPLVSRAEVATRLGDFVSDRYLDDAKDYYVETSGTTTGTPLRAPADLACWYEYAGGVYDEFARFIPELLQAVEPGKTGVVLVSNKQRRQRESVVVVSLRSSLLRRRMIGRDAEEDRAVVEELRAGAVPLLYGKSVYLLELADLDGRTLPRGGGIRPGAILVSGENLFASHRRRLEGWFGCRVYNAYLSMEGGLIACECEHRNGLHLCTTRAVVEVLGEDGEARSEGSGELVVTNLMNWALPFVRYRSGDFGTVRSTTCLCGRSGPTLVDFPGREATRFATAAGSVDPRCLDAALEGLPMRQFQVVQGGGDGVRVTWIPAAPDVEPGGVEREVRRAIRERLGDVPVQVEAVERITPKGGKIRRYVTLREDLRGESPAAALERLVPAAGLFREEAIAGHAASAGWQGELVPRPPDWIRLTYWLLTALFIAALLWGSLAALRGDLPLPVPGL